MDNIIRKTLLYKTGVEYGDFTINHIQGCSHGCKYPCYAFLMAKRFGKVDSYDEWIKPRIVSNTLELLEEEIPKFKNKIRFVHLCFSTDPFMYNQKEVIDLSIKAIYKLNMNGVKCTILTKGILPDELDQMHIENEYGITLISLNEIYRSEYEPFSAPYLERINSLYKLHKKGFKTWVSIEPYPTPNILKQDFNEILNTISFVDKIIFGRLNYNPLVTKYTGKIEYYNNLSEQVINFCNSNSIKYHIKNRTFQKILMPVSN
ncbi:MAG: radical SAM protein [Candidatus Humimicrobiaceae bacterium]